jgi:hypothetical protein
MSKHRPEPPAPSAAGERKPPSAAPPEAKPKAKAPRAKSTSPWPWGRVARLAASAALAFHITAVFTAPWYIQLWPTIVPMIEPGGVVRDAAGRELSPEQMRQYPMQTPVLPRTVNKALRHYANILFINHGYDFFSPDPGVSHVVRYEVFSDAGQSLAKGQLPNRREQWPRLFYHRHMMLVEQSLELGGEANAQSWLRRIADRLLEKYDGDRIRLVLLRHHLLTPQQVLSGARIDGDATYEQLDVVEQRRVRTPAENSPGTAS